MVESSERSTRISKSSISVTNCAEEEKKKDFNSTIHPEDNLKEEKSAKYSFVWRRWSGNIKDEISVVSAWKKRRLDKN